MRATYHGAQREVDDQLDRLFGYLDDLGSEPTSTLVVLTSDHGEMGGDHWLFEKLGYWDESFHVPLIVRDPEPASTAGRGRVVDAFTESVDVLPTICRWLGIEVPLQADGFALQPFLSGDGRRTPDHWRTEAHWSWNFSNPATRMAERYLGIPMAHCTLDVRAGSRRQVRAVRGRRRPCCPRSSSTSPPIPTSCTTWFVRGGRRPRLAVGTAAPAVEDAHRRPYAGRHAC